MDRFPVSVGTPHQKHGLNKEEALKRINKHNGITDVYVSLYNGVVNKVAWDFDIDPEKEDRYDNWEEMLRDFRKLTRLFDEAGYQQMSVLSGGGMHKYLKTDVANLEYPRDAIREVQQKYQEELDLRTDDAIFGDINRIMRVPNTWHPGAQRYCIPLKPEEVYYDKEELFELAQYQRAGIKAITEGRPYSIRQHDKMGSKYTSYGDGGRVPGNFNPAEVEPQGTVFPIYPCISNLLKNQDKLEKKGHGLGFRRRFLIILHLKETGHTIEETTAILKKHLNDHEFHHAVRKEKQVRQIYKRDDMIFPRCEKLMTEIPCIHDPQNENPCESKDNLYV